MREENEEVAEPHEVDTVDRLLADFVLASENQDERAGSIEAWTEGLSADEAARFARRAALYLGMKQPVTPNGSREVPQRIGRFEVRSVLARRPRSVVYAGFDPSLEREVALKVLQGESDPQSVRRLLLEARTLARLEHPDLVRIHEVASIEGQPFLVLELVHGQDLSRVARDESPDGIRIEIERSRDLARVLAWLHEQGVIHRDIKPSNVILRPDGRPALADFGLVRVLDRESSLTGPLLGTPIYLAPEVALDPSRAGPEADVYALACLTIERSSGSPPHEGFELAEVFARLIEGAPPFPRSVLRGLPPGLVPTLELCLDPRAGRRPSASELADDFDAWLQGRPLTLGARTPFQRARQTLFTRRSLLLGIGAGTGLLAVGVLSAIWSGKDPSKDPLTRAIQLVFDTGDIPSEIDPITRCEDGFSRIAGLFLSASTAELQWERERLDAAEALLAALPSAARRERDARFLAACLACRRGRAAELPEILGPEAGSTAGLAMRAEIARIEGRDEAGDLLARARQADARAPLDAFFLALAELAALEAERAHSVNRPIDEERTRGCARLVIQVQQSSSRWSAWARLLETCRVRLLGRYKNFQEAARISAGALPASFWALYLKTAADTLHLGSQIMVVQVWKELSDRFPESAMARDVFLSFVIRIHPDFLREACERRQEDPGRSVLVFDCCFGTFEFGKFRGPGPDSLEAQVFPWLEREPGSWYLPVLPACAWLVGELDREPSEECWGALGTLESGHRVVAETLSRLRERGPVAFDRDPRALHARLATGTSDIEKELFRDLDLLPPETRSHEAVDLAGNFMIQRFLAWRAAHADLLAALLDVNLRAYRPMALVPFTSACLGWSRELCRLPAHAPAERSLRLALGAEAILGPVRVRSGDELRSIERLVRRLVSPEQAEKARSELKQAVTELAMAPTSTQLERMSVSGAAYLICHLAGLLGEGETLLHHAELVCRYSSCLYDRRPGRLAQSFR